uniref:Ataxin 2 n=1 Tax=Neogobius melanostomus TaxID=47308 RepID=A0A8C6UPB6_9GOBI
MKAGGNRSKPGGGSGAGTTSGAGGSGGGRQSLGRGRHSGKGPSSVIFNGVYANMRMVHVLTSVVGTKCELKVKNGAVYEGVFKTYGPECDLVLDAAHRKSTEPSTAPRKEDIVESIIFKASDVVVVTFKDVDPIFARKDNFTDSAVSGKINGEHKEKDLEPWDGGETHQSDSLESLDTDVSNGWDPNDMFKFNEEKYGVLSTYDSSLSTYTYGSLERDNSEEYLKREARAAQLAEEIEASATYKARVALENDERTEEEKYTAVVRGERDGHTLSRESKYIPPGQRNREAMSWGQGRQNSPRLSQNSAGPSTPRPGPHDYSPSANTDQRVVNGGPPRMSPKSQRTPRTHRGPPCRTPGAPPGLDLIPHNAPIEVPAAPPTRNSSGGTWSSVVSGAHRPRSPRQNSVSGASPGSSSLPSPQTGTAPIESTGTPCASSPTAASPAPNMLPPSADGKDGRVQETRQTSPIANKENIKPSDSSPSITRPVCKGPPSMAPDHRKQIDNLKKFSVDFRVSTISVVCVGGLMNKTSAAGREAADEGVVVITPGTPGSSAAPSSTSNSSKPGSPAALSPSPSAPDLKRAGLDMNSQGVQTTTTSAFSGAKHEDKEEKKEAVQDQVRKSTLNPNANEFKPRVNSQVCTAAFSRYPKRFTAHYSFTPYLVVVSYCKVRSISELSCPVANMPQQRSEQHHAPGTPTMMHSVTAAGPPIVAPNPAYSTQYFCSPQQFTSQPLVQQMSQMSHYQSQTQHMFSPVMQGSARMMAPPTHGQPSSSQYAEQTATLHPHAQHPQPSRTPNHPTASPVQHPQHQQAAALHLANQPQQQQMYSALAHTPPSMTPGPNPQSPQASFQSAQQTVYIHPQVQHGYNHNHMAHMQQAHMQSGILSSHHPAATHPPMMLMATQGPGGPQPPMPQTALNPIPVSSATHFSYLAHAPVQHHQQQL